jgi:hypothetical protein
MLLQRRVTPVLPNDLVKTTHRPLSSLFPLFPPVQVPFFWLPSMNDSVSRRDFLAASSAVTAGSLLAAAAQGDDKAETPRKTPLRLAAINSIYRLRSHAYHIVNRFVFGYPVNGFHHQPPFQIVRMFNDQYPKDDLSRTFCKRQGIELCKTVAEAIGGERTLDVDGVLLIIEHGDYPVNEFGQILYPRFKFFDQVVRVFHKSGRTVPVFVDKHLSYDRRHAVMMVETARKLKFGLMAGSSLPVTWRIPSIEPPLGTPFSEAVVCFGFDRGPAEIYLFHALEVLQCMLERRAGGETGVKSVTCLRGDAVWKAGDEGRWSTKLLNAAIACNPSRNVGPVRENVSNPQAILVEYRDGTRGAVLNLIEQVADFSFAARVRGSEQPIVTHFYLPPPPGAKFFDPLTFNIEKFLAAGTSPYPVERTLLTSTMLDLALHSQHDGGKVVSDPALDIRYAPPVSSGFFRGPV